MHFYLYIAVTSETDIATLGVQKVSWQAWPLHRGGRFGSFRTPQGTIGAAARTRRGIESHFTDLGMIWGLLFESILDSDGLDSVFSFGLASWSLFVPISN